MLRKMMLLAYALTGVGILSLLCGSYNIFVVRKYEELIINLRSSSSSSSMGKGDHKEKGVAVEEWGAKGVLIYTLSSDEFMQVRITNWGATIVSLCLSEAKTGSVDVVLGFDSINSYMNGMSEYFGCIVGRVANRIKDACFNLDGHTYKLPANDNSNTLHGGHKGFDKVLWQSRVVEDSATPSVEFTYHSYDGEQGFPGELDVSVTYTLQKKNELKVEMKAVGNKTTPVSLAQHSYWNLGGHDNGDVSGHILRIPASHYTPVDDNHIPTGQIVEVSGTAYDFSDGRVIGSRMKEAGGGMGYDHNYVLDGTEKDEVSGLHLAAQLRDPLSGRSMDVFTNAVGMQFYSGNFLEATVGKGSAVYRKHAGVCLETQGFPNAVNEPNFPDILLSPGQLYQHSMLYRFSGSKDL